MNALRLLQYEKDRRIWHRLDPRWWFRTNLYRTQYWFWNDQLKRLCDKVTGEGCDADEELARQSALAIQDLMESEDGTTN